MKSKEIIALLPEPYKTKFANTHSIYTDIEQIRHVGKCIAGLNWQDRTYKESYQIISWHESLNNKLIR